MSILEDVLMEEYDRSLRISRALRADNSSLPRGSVRRRVIKGREYYYLQYRDGERVRSEYIRREDLDSVQKAVARRRENEAALKEQERSRAQIIKALGRSYVDEHSAE